MKVGGVLWRESPRIDIPAAVAVHLYTSVRGRCQIGICFCLEVVVLDAPSLPTHRTARTGLQVPHIHQGPIGGVGSAPGGPRCNLECPPRQRSAAVGARSTRPNRAKGAAVIEVVTGTDRRRRSKLIAAKALGVSPAGGCTESEMGRRRHEVLASANHRPWKPWKAR